MASADQLQLRIRAARDLVQLTRPVFAELGVRVDERSATAMPLALAALDTADAIFVLLEQDLAQFWVAALTLQRTQMEYVLRAAFFAKAAGHEELMRFRRTGKMPKRGKRVIHIAEVAREAGEHLGWDSATLLKVVNTHQKSLSGLVHGGVEVLGIYTQHLEWGDLTINWDELAHNIDNISVFVQLALSVAMLLSPLDPDALDKAVRPVYDRSVSYFSKKNTKR